jgi:hypothetical protein
MNRFQTLLYPPVTLLDVARDDGNVAVVYDREEVEDRHIQARVVASEEVGGAAYPLRAEAGLSLSAHSEYHYPASDSLLISDSLITSEGSL